jgi:signal transduction histidine kinase
MTESSTAPNTPESPVTSGVRRIRQALLPGRRVSRLEAIAGPSSAMFTTIRNRLIFWYIGILAAILLLLGLLLYFAMQQTLYTQVNNNLAASSQFLTRAWQINFVRNDPVNICQDQDQGTQTAINSELAQLNVPYLTCFDARPVSYVAPSACQSPYPNPNFQSTCRALIIDPTLAREALASDTNTATDRVSVSGLGTVQRYAQVVFGPDGSVLGVVQTAAPIDGQLTALTTLGRLLLVCGLLTILGAAAGGIFMAKRALEPAHLAFTRQQEFIADAAHELRTPLTLLRANAEVLLRGRERLDPDDALLLEDIVTESAHMGALANNLLTLARLDAESESLNRDVVDIEEIAEALIRRAGALAEEQQVILSQVGSTEPALVVGDEMLINEAALILVDNAIKYNKTGGSVTIEVVAAAQDVSLSVRDTGIGIQEEHLLHLGERFYRPDKARSRELGGAGLGLSIARSIATTHGGTLHLSSEPGVGTTATLTFPAAQVVQ